MTNRNDLEYEYKQEEIHYVQKLTFLKITKLYLSLQSISINVLSVQWIQSPTFRYIY